MAPLPVLGRSQQRGLAPGRLGVCIRTTAEEKLHHIRARHQSGSMSAVGPLPCRASTPSPWTSKVLAAILRPAAQPASELWGRWGPRAGTSRSA